MTRVYVSGTGLITRSGHSIIEIIKSIILEEDLKPKESLLITDYSLQFKNINFCANLGINASDQAMMNQDCKRFIDNRTEYGTFVGTAFGGFTNTQIQQTSALINEGPLGVSPGLSIHSGFHLTGDIISIKNKFEGPNITFTSGENSSGLAFMEAFDQIKFQYLQGAIVVGTEFIDEILIEAHQLLNHQNANILSSGAGGMFLSNQSNASTNVEVLSIQHAGTSGKVGRYSSSTYKSISSSIVQVLKDSSLDEEEIDLIISTIGPNSLENLHLTRGIKKIFGEKGINKVIYPKKFLGDIQGANFIIGATIGTEFLLASNDLTRGLGPLRNILIVSGDSYGSIISAILQKGE